MIIVPQACALLSITPEPEILLERAGRCCYRSEDKITAESAPKFVQMICKRQHESVLEHAVATFLLTTHRGITHELVRHRLAAYSQESTRYVGYHKKGNIRVVKPLGMSEEQEAIWRVACEQAEASYFKMVEAGCPPEVARDVLPTCTAADIVTTMNFRQWRHVIKLRTSKAAHPQIRELIGMVRDELLKQAPTVFGPQADPA